MFAAIALATINCLCVTHSKGFNTQTSFIIMSNKGRLPASGLGASKGFNRLWTFETSLGFREDLHSNPRAERKFCGEIVDATVFGYKGPGCTIEGYKWTRDCGRH